ncbi:ADP-ribose-binding protein [Geobacter sp. SVR]|uniref:ADP-ribose-binding protein n=1 Tax=Geobacter sp. SVR TaxID=2495594 RepID=UPI00143F0274|nr:ADP-ribose-binding protein [Geobacter sp. SVR]BCS53108.1 ADP-ribose-binding protein [Geobacter sp. SVR]GCF84493.1 ADP-ribose-binding protein [Geobacter sp. SVR]
MQEIVADMWGFAGQAVIAITTNGTVTGDGRAVFGRGCARQAGARYPDLAHRLGGLLLEHGNHVFPLGHGLVSFPVEETAWSLPDPLLIARSAQELRMLADHEGWTRVVVPRPGCGYGGLEWGMVRPLLEPMFDQRFTVIRIE